MTLNTDLISRSAAIKIAERYGCNNGSVLGRHSGVADCIASEIAKLPVIDAEPVRYGANEYIYCAVDENDQIVWVKGSSSKTRYFKTRHYLDKAVEYHNKYNPDDPWRIARFSLIEEVS